MRPGTPPPVPGGGGLDIATTIALEDGAPVPHALRSVLSAGPKLAALTGAGISVESGIPDFRSPGGLWERFDPAVYAAIETFLASPERSWELFRAVDDALRGARPNPAHDALARLEAAGALDAVITQNIDGLHQAAGSRRVIEVHGDHRRLECLKCRTLEPSRASTDAGAVSGDVPRCHGCGFPLKPNVVLFGEAVRDLDRAEEALRGCDTLLVIGTSAEVYPVALFPRAVKERGGRIIEFNLRPTPLTGTITDFFFHGTAGIGVPLFASALLESRGVRED